MSIEEKAIEVASESVKGLATELYSDLAKPSLRQFGIAIETLIKVGLSPITILNLAYERSFEWIKQKIRKRIDETPREFLKEPLKSLAVPLITQIALSDDSEELRELYAELLMKAMDTRHANSVHPSYVQILSQITSREAVVAISFLEFPSTVLMSEKTSSDLKESVQTLEIQFAAYCFKLTTCGAAEARVWLVNLVRLGLLTISTYFEAELIEKEPSDFYGHDFVRNKDFRHLRITEFGLAFLRACAPVGFSEPSKSSNPTAN